MPFAVIGIDSNLQPNYLATCHTERIKIKWEGRRVAIFAFFADIDNKKQKNMVFSAHVVT
jgi:hypothetical protein